MAQGFNLRANPVLLAWISRFLTDRADIETAYQEAATAKKERLVEVVITSGTHEGGGTSGQLAGDPEEMMVACEVALQNLDDQSEEGVVSPSRSGGAFFNFCNRPMGS